MQERLAQAHNGAMSPWIFVATLRGVMAMGRHTRYQPDEILAMSRMSRIVVCRRLTQEWFVKPGKRRAHSADGFPHSTRVAQAGCSANLPCFPRSGSLRTSFARSPTFRIRMPVSQELRPEGTFSGKKSPHLAGGGGPFAAPSGELFSTTSLPLPPIEHNIASRYLAAPFGPPPQTWRTQTANYRKP